jgi:hypothetical protein
MTDSTGADYAIHGEHLSTPGLVESALNAINSGFSSGVDWLGKTFAGANANMSGVTGQIDNIIGTVSRANALSNVLGGGDLVSQRKLQQADVMLNTAESRARDIERRMLLLQKALEEKRIRDKNLRSSMLNVDVSKKQKDKSKAEDLITTTKRIR